MFLWKTPYEPMNTPSMVILGLVFMTLLGLILLMDKKQRKVALKSPIIEKYEEHPTHHKEENIKKELMFTFKEHKE